MIDHTDDNSVLAGLMRCSPGDVSILEMVLAKAPSSDAPAPSRGLFGKKPSLGEAIVMTTAGSPNDELWSALEKRGWMARKTKGHFPGIDARQFVILPAGRAPIAAMLAKRAQEFAFGSKVPAIVNDLCVPFLKAVIERVHLEGGQGRDTAAVISVVLSRYALSVAAEGREGALIDDVAGYAKTLTNRELERRRDSASRRP